MWVHLPPAHVKFLQRHQDVQGGIEVVMLHRQATLGNQHSQETTIFAYEALVLFVGVFCLGWFKMCHVDIDGISA